MSEEKLLVNEKEIVVPGEQIAEGVNFIAGNGVNKLGTKILAGRLGVLSVDGKMLRLMPLSGRYIPKYDDRIIGKVIDVLMTGWRLDINSPYSSVLTLKDASSDFIQRGADLTQYYDLGEWIICKITNA